MKKLLLLFLIVANLFSCKKEESDNSSNKQSPSDTIRTFRMGFSTWPYAQTLGAIDSTYSFIDDHADIYSEQIDDKIPWTEWINNTPLPSSFTNEIARKISRRMANKELVLSVSLLNGDRSDLIEDITSSNTPSYTTLNDSIIENAYFKHIDYLIDQLNPDYLIAGMEVNELLIADSSKWVQYKSLMTNVTSRISTKHPSLKISESVTLHNWFNPENINNSEAYIQELTDYVNNMDFASISFYPFFKNQSTKTEYQQALDFLHSKVTIPIAFVETNQIAENHPTGGIILSGSDQIQNDYLEVLIKSAEDKKYEFFIWWAHHDYDRLWNDLGQGDGLRIWRDTGILDGDGEKRTAKDTWDFVFKFPYK